jgi:hypothetical protein
MTRLILRLLTALLAFGFGVALERFLISPAPAEVPKVESPAACDPSRTEVRTVFVPAPSPSPHVIFEYDPVTFDTYGTYLIAGKRPKDFDELSYLMISPYVQAGKLRGDVWIHTESETTEESKEAVFALITHRRVLVVTRQSTTDGIEYRFDGEFLYKNLHAFANKENTPVLRGTLTKIQNGQKVAEAAVSFSLGQFHGC